MKILRKSVSVLLVLTMILSMSITVFADFTDTKVHWANKEIDYLAEKTILNGYPDGSFKPQGLITRAEVSKMIKNISGEIVNTPSTVSKDAKGNLLINTKGVVLKDMLIAGDLYLTEGIGDGDVTLENVIVKGNIFDNSGSGSLILKENTTIVEETEDSIVDKAVSATAINSGQKLADSELSGTFKDVLNKKIEGKLTWITPTTIVTETGEHKWSFIPQDTETYNLVTGDVLVVVNEIEIPVSDFSGGSGTESDPYQVSTAKELNNIRNHLDKHFIQTADINLGVTPWNTGQGWDPLGNTSREFGGTYNGQGYKITGLTINRDSMCGLFGRNSYSSELKNIALVDVNISGKDNIGSLLGYSRGNVYNCYATGSVTGNQAVGGLIGFMAKGNVRDSYSTCSVKANDRVGGLTGYISEGGAIYNCYAVGLVTGNNSVGGLVGLKFWPSIIVSQSYYDKETTGQNDTGKGEGKTTSQMTQKSTFDGWNFDSIWSIKSSPPSYPYLK